MSATKTIAAPGSPAAGPRPSWQSRCLDALLRALPIRKKLASAQAVQETVRRLATHPAPHAPSGLGRGVDVHLEHVGGWPVYRTARAAAPDSGNYVVFLHGGGFIHEIVRAHWKFIAHLNRKAGARCVVPIYPLVPHATVKDVVPATGELLRQVLHEAGDAKVLVVGNSAGACLALAAAQWLRDTYHLQPNGLVLISPGLDASVGRPEQQAIAAVDPVQDVPGVRECGRLWAGELGVAHPFASPLKGDMAQLAPMLVFAGTHDLLYPDSVELEAKARAAGTPVTLYLRAGQPHNYPAMPTPEGREAREAIVRAVAQGLR